MCWRPETAIGVLVFLEDILVITMVGDYALSSVAVLLAGG